MLTQICLPLRLSCAIRRERPFFRPIAEFTNLRPDPEERQAPARAFVKDTLYPTLSEWLHLIGGRPGMGKLMLLTKLAESGTPVYYCTQEHLNVRCARRILSLLPDDVRHMAIFLRTAPRTRTSLRFFARQGARCKPAC